MKNKLLTPLELKVMNIIWRLKKCFVKDILENWPEEPKPAYNTISTTVRILQDKKAYVDHEAFGRTHRYFPVVSKLDYQKKLMANVLQNAFSGSVSSMLSALVNNDQIDETELDDLQNMIGEEDK